MERQSFLKNTQIVIRGLCIAAATIVSTVILSQALLRVVKFQKEIISVTGAAEKKILLDYLVWKMQYSRRASTLTEAFAQLKDDLRVVKQYLLAKGIGEQEIVVSQVTTEVLYKKTEKEGRPTNAVEGYLLRQEIEVRSSDVQKVTAISREATELIDQGI